jgi:hypothetical protein
MAFPRIAALWLIAMVAAPAYGQAQTGATHLGPIQCYVHATEIAALESLNAKQLCIGATSVAPAQCFAEASDRALLSDLDAVRLCQVASSTAPAACAERLRATTALTSSPIVDYCVALRWTLVQSGTGGVPECVETALDRTALTNDDAVRLCAGAVSTAPVACYELGKNETALTNSDIVDLCTLVVLVPYTPWLL